MIRNVSAQVPDRLSSSFLHGYSLTSAGFAPIVVGLCKDVWTQSRKNAQELLTEVLHQLTFSTIVFLAFKHMKVNRLRCETEWPRRRLLYFGCVSIANHV